MQQPQQEGPDEVAAVAGIWPGLPGDGNGNGTVTIHVIGSCERYCVLPRNGSHCRHNGDRATSGSPIGGPLPGLALAGAMGPATSSEDPASETGHGHKVRHPGAEWCYRSVTWSVTAAPPRAPARNRSLHCRDEAGGNATSRRAMPASPTVDPPSSRCPPVR